MCKTCEDLTRHSDSLVSFVARSFTVGAYMGVPEFGVAIPVVRLPSYYGPKTDFAGMARPAEGVCQRQGCGSTRHLSSTESGYTYCFNCWKRLPVIAVREGCDVIADERTNKTTYAVMCKRGYLPNGMYHLGGNVMDYPIAADSTLYNELLATYLRITNPMPRVNRALFSKFIRQVKDFLPEFFERLPEIQWVTFEEWNAHFPPARRATNLTTWEKIRVGEDVKAFTKEEYKRILRQLPFLKKDKDPKGEGLCSVKAPRFIMAQTDEVSIILGMVIMSINRAIEKLLKAEMRDDNGAIIFACGLTPYDLSKTFQRVKDFDYQSWDDDFSQYDSTQHEQLCLFLVDIYDFIFKNKVTQQAPDGLMRAFKHIRTAICGLTRGRTRFGLLLQIPGTMKSGQADTCLGNSLTNIFTHLFAISENNPGLSMRQVYRDLIMHVLGDDNSMACPDFWKLDKVEDIMLQLGLISKLEKKDFFDIKFLNMMPIPVEKAKDGLDIRMTVMPGRILKRILYTHKEPVDRSVHCFALAKCLEAIADHHPLIKSFSDGLRDAYGTSRKPLFAKIVYRNDWQLEKSNAFKNQGLGWYLAQCADELSKQPKATPNAETDAYIQRRYRISHCYEEVKEAVRLSWKTSSSIFVNQIILRDAE